jgi:hypothetical protein
VTAWFVVTTDNASSTTRSSNIGASNPSLQRSTTRSGDWPSTMMPASPIQACIVAAGSRQTFHTRSVSGTDRSLGTRTAVDSAGAVSVQSTMSSRRRPSTAIVPPLAFSRSPCGLRDADVRLMLNLVGVCIGSSSYSMCTSCPSTSIAASPADANLPARRSAIVRHPDLGLRRSRFHRPSLRSGGHAFAVAGASATLSRVR